MRWSEDEGRVTVFRYPANNSNGNTFDFQGRQLSCEHLMRRVVRYEHDGSVTIIADNYGGKRLNSPNDVVPHPDGSYWFTDPPYGGGLFEGQPDAAGGPTNASGRLNPRLGLPPELGTFRRELPTGVYRVDSSGKVDLVVGEGPGAGSERARRSRPITSGCTSSAPAAAPAIPGPGGTGEMFVVRCGEQPAHEPAVCSAISWSTASMRSRWRPLRRRRQRLVLEQCRPRRRLQRRHRLESERHAHRPHSTARGVRERILRWPEAQPSLHGGEPVVVLSPLQYPGRRARVNYVLIRIAPCLRDSVARGCER